MNAREAQQVLLLYRPGTPDAEDPQVVEAMALARQDPSLARWFEQHCAFQDALRAKFRQIEVPAHVKLAALAARPNKRGPAPSPYRLWRAPNRLWLSAAAAAVALLIGGATLGLKPASRRNDLTNFQARMVGAALREYRMDIETGDMQTVRSYLSAHGSPSDYDVAPGLQRLSLTGGGVLRWQNNSVSMVCFDKGDRQMLFLFVLKKSALQDPPPENPKVARLNDVLAAAWSRGANAYVLAGPAESGFPGKYF